MSGRDRLIIIARRVHGGGDGRWVVEVLDSIENLVCHSSVSGGAWRGVEGSDFVRSRVKILNQKTANLVSPVL